MRPFLALCSLAPLYACGARSELDLGQVDASVATADAEVFEEAEVDASVLCSLNLGPIAACVPGADAGPVQRCTSETPLCTNTSTLTPTGWVCCAPSPQGGWLACSGVTPGGPSLCE